jgi:septal ring factor EnvC (AmiA/AmiB activator)
MTEPRPRPQSVQPANPIVLSPALLRTPIAGPYLVAAPWARWLQASWGRQGGAQAPSNAELDEGLTGTQGDLSQTQDDLTQTQGDLSQTQNDLTQTQGDLASTQTDLAALTTRVTSLETTVATLQTDLTALTARVTTLETTVAAHATRLDALEAWRTAIAAGLPALVAVVAVPTLANDPATAILLENDLTANWQPPINANDAALQTAVNAVRTALAA